VSAERTAPVEFGSGLRSHIAHEPPAEEPPLLRPQSRPPLSAKVPAATPPANLPLWEYTPSRPAETRKPSTLDGESARDLLRTRAAAQLERIWSVFDEALAATDTQGRPDHELRLRAAEALLAQIKPAPVTAPHADKSHPNIHDDELAKHRHARHQQR
jgi:hypothetical protein